MSGREFDAVIPVLCVTAAGLIVLMAEAFRSKDEQIPLAPLALIGLGASAFVTFPWFVLLPHSRLANLLWNRNTTSFGVVSGDNFALFVVFALSIAGIITVIFSMATVRRDKLPEGEYYATLLFAVVGMMLMAQATDLLLIFLALETMSIAVYVLTGMRRDQQASTEAAFKYFLLGAFASSFFLYGVAFVYGVTGSTSLSRISSV